MKENIKNIIVLNLTGNKKLEYYNSSKFLNLISCCLSNNSIFFINKNSFYYSIILEYLDLSKNPLKNIDFLENFPKNSFLLYLDISNTNFKTIKFEYFQNFKKLKILKIMNCKLNSIEIFKRNFKNLIELNLNNTEFPPEFQTVFVKSLNKIKIIFNKNYNLCCLAWFYFTKNVECQPSKSEFQTCSSLLGSSLSKLFFWLYGIFGFLANLFSLFFILQLNNKNQYFNILLIIGDLLSSVYILSIASADIYFKQDYLHFESKWRTGNTCKILGSLFSLSMLISGVSLLVITCQKYFAVKYPMKQFFPITYFRPFIIIFLLTAIFLSTLPNFLYKVTSFFFLIKYFTIFLLLIISPPKKKRNFFQKHQFV